MGTVFLAVSIVCNVIANGFFKAASGVEGLVPRKMILYGIGLFIGLLNTLAYLKSLETLRLATAYAVFAASSTILIAMVSLWMFREDISLQKAIGLLTIAVGMLLLWKS